MKVFNNKLNTAYAVVTGASSGIGWYISKELAERGYSIVAISNQVNQLQDLKIELERDFQVAVITLDIDLSQPNAAATIFDFCQLQNLNVEVLVNNAGVLVYGEVINIELERAEKVLQLHMNTPALLCRLFGEQMVGKQKGYILNVSSISAVMPYPTISLYGPTKTFLRKFSRAFRTEMKGSGVHVLCLLPGATATDLYKNEKVNIPLAMKLGVMKKPEDVARISVRALFKNRGESIPGLINKLTMFFIPFIPNLFVSFIYRKTKK